MIVTDKILMANGITDKVTKHLEENGLPYSLFDGVIPNPTVTCVTQCFEAYQNSGADYILAVGGGSVIDTAKAVALIATNPWFADVVSLEGKAVTMNPGMPMIAVPTTAGSGSEVSIYCVLTDETRQRKFVCIDPNCIPAIAIVDANMMATLPPEMCAAMGMGAIAQAVDAFMCRNDEIPDSLALSAIDLVADHLEGAMEGKKHSQNHVAEGQYLAGLAFSNVGLCLTHAMAFPLTSQYGVPTNVVSAILLPYVMEFNMEEEDIAYKYLHISRALGYRYLRELPSEDEEMEAVVRVFKDLADKVGLPTNLAAVGVKVEDIPSIAESAMQSPFVEMNPLECTREDVIRIYQKAFEGKELFT